MVKLQQSCPCGSGATYDACCGRLHRGAALAATAEELMRSRYSAYATGHLDHVFRTWHPRTRPLNPTGDPAVAWTALRVLRTTGGGPVDETGTVEFEARYDSASGPGVLHELSRFERRAGRWVYVDGDLSPT